MVVAQSENLKRTFNLEQVHPKTRIMLGVVTCMSHQEISLEQHALCGYTNMRTENPNQMGVRLGYIYLLQVELDSPSIH